jgi:tetratricopeptide (TPR) repeat protein
MADARLPAAVALFAAGQVGEARQACERLLAGVPQHAGALHLLGLIAHRGGEFENARGWLRAATEAPGATALMWLSYAELACKGVDSDGALRAARRAVALADTSAFAVFCLGNLCMDARQFAEACRCYERAVSLDPMFWPAGANLGLLVGRLGAPTAARARFEALLAAHPDHPGIRQIFAVHHQEQGEHAAALTQITRAIAAQPAEISFELQAADLELEMDRPDAALARLEALAARAPQEAGRITLQAHALRRLDRHTEAALLCGAALAAGADSAELLRAYGLALQAAGSEQQALELFERAAAKAAGLTAARALCDKAVLLGDQNRLSEARACFDRALDIEPRFAAAWYNKVAAGAHAADGTEIGTDIGAMETLLTGDPPHRDRLLLHFALGQCYLETGDPAAAFRHLHAGNRMKRAVISYDAERATLTMHAIAARDLRQRMHAPNSEQEHWTAAAGPDAVAVRGHEPAEALRSELPVFVVGMPRSGSTLIEQILASHPQVHGGGELLGLRGLFEQAAQGDASAVADESPAAAAESRDAALSGAALDRLRRAAGAADRVIDKDLQNFLHLGIIHRLLPRARIIHCRRDPLDTCVSAYTKLFAGNLGFAYDQAELGRYYRDYHDLMAYWRRVLPAASLLEVDYEIVVTDPAAQARRMLEFLGLPWTDRCLDFHSNRRTVSTSSFAQVRRPLYRTSIGRARSMQAHVAPLEQALGDLIIRD